MATDDDGHILAHLDQSIPAKVHIGPDGQAGTDFDTMGNAELLAQSLSTNKPLYDETLTDEVNGLPPPLPRQPDLCAGRGPLLFEPNSYATIEPGRKFVTTRDEAIPLVPGAEHYVDNREFQRLAERYRGHDGKYMAMTCYGAVPVPNEVMSQLPDHFEQEPIIKEQEHFVLKQKKHERKLQKDFVQHHHHFVEVPKSTVVDKIIPAGGKKKIEIPHYTYKGVIADDIVEVPLGTKYVEVPLDVYMKKPPKLVPVVKPMVIQRVIECNKHVVQDRIVEVPKIIKRSVPRPVVKELPYIKPKYVDKIVEVPFKPGMRLPKAQGIRQGEMPPPPDGYMAVGVSLSLRDDRGDPLVLGVDGKSLYTTVGAPFADPQGRPYTLSANGRSYKDVDGVEYWNDPRDPKNQTPLSGPFSQPGTPIYVPASPSLRLSLSANGSPRVEGADESAGAAFGIIGLPLAAVASVAAQSAPSEANAAFLGEDATFDGTTLTFNNASDGVVSAIVPQNVKEITLPYEAEIDISVVACDPDTGLPIPEEERDQYEIPPSQASAYWQVPNTPREVRETMALSSNLPVTPGSHLIRGATDIHGRPVQPQQNTVYYPPSRMSDNSGAIMTETVMSVGGRSPIGSPRRARSPSVRPSDAVSHVSGNTYHVPDPEHLVKRGFYTSSPVPPETPRESHTEWDSSLPKPPQLSYDYKDDVAYAAPMEAILEVEAPGMRQIAYTLEGGAPSVVTNTGVRNLNTLEYSNCCGDAIESLKPPFDQSRVPVPIDSSKGTIDVKALDFVQDEYINRLNPSFHVRDDEDREEAPSSSRGMASRSPRSGRQSRRGSANTQQPGLLEANSMASSVTGRLTDRSHRSSRSHVTESKSARDATSAKNIIKKHIERPKTSAEEKVRQAESLRQSLEPNKSGDRADDRQTQ